MSIFGLYLGGDFLSVAAMENGDLSVSERYPFSSGAEAAQEGSVNLEVLLNKVSREMNISPKEDIYLSLHDRDFIFRSFVIPCMSRKEIESSIEFEIEKYIPFKIEELIWNYSYERISNEKKLIVSFIGYNKQAYKKLSDIFPHLDLNLVAVEPSSLSLLRLVRALPLYKKLNWYVILDYSEHDCYITFFYGNLPVFSRTICSSSSEAMDREKLSEEIRFSFQYFKREYRAYDLEKMIVVSEQEKAEKLADLSQELDLSIDVLSPDQLINQGQAGMDSLKAFGAACYEKNISFRPLLEETSSGFLYGKKGFAPPLNIALCALVFILGVIITSAGFVAVNSDLSFRRTKLKEVQDKFALKGSVSAFDVSSLEASLDSKKANLSLAEKKIDAFRDTKLFLKKITSFATDGLWFDVCTVKNDPGQTEIQVSGYVYLGDQAKERDSLDRFISSIRNDEAIKQVFVKPLFYNQDRTVLNEFSVLRFIIKLN